MESIELIRSHLSQTLMPYWTPTYIWYGVITFSWLVFLWNTYLAIRQFRLYLSTKEVPSELNTILDQETLEKARAYNIDRARFSFISGTFDEIQGTLVLIFLLPLLWSKSGELRDRLHLQSSSDSVVLNEITQSLIFTLISTLLSALVGLPFSLYSTFVIEERHGFNKQTLGFYAKDKVKKLLVSFAITSPIIAAIIAIVRLGGPYFFFYLWVFVTFVTLVLMAFHAEIAALFDKFTPLPEGELRNKIKTLASSIKFPLTQIYVVKGSARSAHSNAYFFGFFNRKRIVLYDTLIKGYKDETEEPNSDKTSKSSEESGSGCDHDEILAVLGHELGHWYLNHVVKNIAFSEVNLLLIFLLFSQLYQNVALFAAFGFHSERPVIIGLMLVMMYIFAPYNEIIGFVTVSLSRRYEFQADNFAKGLGKATELKSALIKLNKDNLGFPVYDKLYSMFNHSHPPLLERIRALSIKEE
ncbi:CAAX prenyl protease 1-like protein, partial [Fragariocoptes setiger]